MQKFAKWVMTIIIILIIIVAISWVTNTLTRWWCYSGWRPPQFMETISIPEEPMPEYKPGKLPFYRRWTTEETAPDLSFEVDFSEWMLKVWAITYIKVSRSQVEFQAYKGEQAMRGVKIIPQNLKGFEAHGTRDDIVFVWSKLPSFRWNGVLVGCETGYTFDGRYIAPVIESGVSWWRISAVVGATTNRVYVKSCFRLW